MAFSAHHRRISIYLPLFVLGLSLLFAIRQLGETTNYTPHAASTTQLGVTLFLHGIGKGGDNSVPNSIGATAPTRPQRPVTLSIYNNTNQLVSTAQGTVNYDSVAGNFQGTVDVGTLPAGAYLIKVYSPQYITKFIPGIQTIVPSQKTTLQPIHLVTGDIDGDNKVSSMTDFNILLSCYKNSNFYNATKCGSQAQMADILDDGVVDQFDYNLFIRELAVQNGDEDLVTPQPTQPTGNPTVTVTPSTSPTATPVPPTVTNKPTLTPTPTIVPGSSLFTITKTASVTQAVPGQLYTYSITAQHKTSSSLTTVTLTDHVSLLLDFLGASISNGSCKATVSTTTDIVCTTKISQTSPSTMTINVRPNSNVQFRGTIIPNTGIVSNSKGSTLISNSANVTVVSGSLTPTTTIMPTPSLTIAPSPTSIPTATPTTAPTPTAMAGTGNFTMTVNISNPSPDWDVQVYYSGRNWVAGTTINNGNPIQCGKVSGAVSPVRITCYNIPLGDQYYYTFGAGGIRKSDGMTTDPIPSEVFVTAPHAGQNLTVPLALTPHTAIINTIGLSASRSEIPRGQTVTYTISAYDNFHLTYQDAEVDDTIDPRMTIVGAVPSQGRCTITGQVVACFIPLKANAPVTININARLNTTAALTPDISNTAIIKSGGQNRSSETVVIRPTL